MKKPLYLLTMSLFLLPASANAGDWYSGIGGGYVFQFQEPNSQQNFDDALDNDGFVLRAVPIGYEGNRGWGAEVAIEYLNADKFEQAFQAESEVITAGLNIQTPLLFGGGGVYGTYWSQECTNGWCTSPFQKFGIGAAIVENEVVAALETLTGQDLGLNTSVGIGVISGNERVAIEGMARWTKVWDVQLEADGINGTSTANLDYESLDLIVTLRVKY